MVASRGRRGAKGLVGKAATNLTNMKMNYFFLGMAITLATAWHLQAQSTAFTYQGRLDDGGNPANGSYDLTFALCSAASGPTQLGAVTNTAVAVSNGLFTVTLDFGNQFPG